MRKGMARVPAYWFHWWPERRSLEFYVKVYWVVRERRVRKSNKDAVMAIMRELAGRCDISVTHLRREGDKKNAHTTQKFLRHTRGCSLV